MIKNFLKNNPIHSKIVKYFDILFLLNPLYFSIIWMLVSWGMAASYYSNFNLEPFYFYLSFSFNDFLFFASLSLIVSSININNQISELNNLDWKKSKNKYSLDLNHLYVAPNFISLKKSYKISRFLLLFGFVIIFFISFKVTFILFIYLLISYCAGKYCIQINSIRLFILKCFFRIILFYLLFLIGWVQSDNYDLLAINSILFIITIIPVILIYEILAIESLSIKERKNRQFIYNKKYLLSFLSLFIMVIVFYLTFLILEYKDPIITHYSLISIPFFCYTAIRNKHKDYIRTFRYSILILNILLSWTLYPLLFIAQFCIYFLSKYYYWHRFNIHFPAFTIDKDL